MFFIDSLIRNQQVGGSNPPIGSIKNPITMRFSEERPISNLASFFVTDAKPMP